MTQDKDQMRAEFEAWARKALGVSGDHPFFTRNSSGDYVFDPMQHRFMGWQAARASAPTGIMDDGQWNIEGANTGEIEAYEHGVRTTMSTVQRILDGDADIGPLSRPMRDYRVLMNEVQAMKASAQAVPDWRKDAERYQALKQRFACIDFAYDFGDGKESTVLCFDWGGHPTAPFFAGLDANIDATMLAAAPQPVAQEGQT